MRWVFALSLAFIVYACLGYPLLAFLKSRWRHRPVRARPIFPPISVVMAARNEAEAMPRKLKNLLATDYPADRCEIIVVSDGSTDSTVEAARGFECDRVKILELAQHEGKAAALNLGVDAARGEIVVFTDARQRLEADAIKNLVSNFADPAVGCVSGELMLAENGNPHAASGMGLYWRLEKLVRQWESASGSVMGATGALYAVRKRFLRRLPGGVILDDIYHPAEVARQGGRVVFESRARAWDEIPSPGKEFRRKVRTVTGNYQLLQLAPWLLTRSNPLRFSFVSHKLARLLLPFALLALLVSSCLAAGYFFKVAAALQIGFYVFACLRLLKIRFGMLTRPADAALAFLVLNAAAALALVYFVIGKKEVWVRA